MKLIPVGVCLLLLVAFGASSATASPTTYKINFTATLGGVPTQAQFTYDPATKTFSAFTVTWNGTVFDFVNDSTSTLKAPFLAPPALPCLSTDTGQAESFDIVSGACLSPSNILEWGVIANAGKLSFDLEAFGSSSNVAYFFDSTPTSITGTQTLAGGQFTTSVLSYPYYFSQLAFGGGYQTTLTYVNYSPQAVTCTTNFYSDSGAGLSIPFSSATVLTRTDTLQPGQSIHDQSVASLGAAVTQGWAQASCTGPVQASALYRFYQSGIPVGEAGVNAETAPTTEFSTFAQTATGVAYANPSATQSAAITFTVYDATGTRLGSTVVTLGPLAHGSANLGPLLGLQSFAGFVKIVSTIPIISLSLNAEAFPVFSALPPGDLPSSTTLVTP